MDQPPTGVTLGSVGNLLASSDAAVQSATRRLITEIVLSVLKTRDCDPEVVRERMLVKRLQDVALTAQKSAAANAERIERVEAALKSRLKDCESKVAALEKTVEQLSGWVRRKNDEVAKEVAKLWELRDEFTNAVSKERHRRLKLFTRWSDTHGSDLEKLNQKLQQELKYLSQRSNQEFVLQSETLETIKDKLDYALMKRYGYVPDTRATYIGEKRIVGGFLDEEVVEHDPGDHLLLLRQHHLQHPKLKGTFNLAADASHIVQGLDNRIDALSGQVQQLRMQSSLVSEAQQWDQFRRLRVRNEGSVEGSVSASDYGPASDDSHDDSSTSAASSPSNLASIQTSVQRPAPRATSASTSAATKVGQGPKSSPSSVATASSAKTASTLSSSVTRQGAARRTPQPPKSTSTNSKKR